MKMLTAQQIFTKVSKHLLKQNKRVVDEHGRADWVDGQGNLCASACLLKPETRKMITAMGFGWTNSSNYMENGVDYDANLRLIIDLTNCHDENKPSRWPRKLRRIAREHNLKIPEFLKNA